MGYRHFVDWRDVEAVTRLKWREPPELSRWRVLCHYRATPVLTVAFWVRLLLCITIPSACIIGLAYAIAPGLQVGWASLWWVFVIMLPISVAGHMLIHTILPVHVDVRSDRIVVHHGFSTEVCPADAIVDVRISESELCRTLDIWVRSKTDECCEIQVGIAHDVEQDQLELLLTRLREGMVRQ